MHSSSALPEHPSAKFFRPIPLREQHIASAGTHYYRKLDSPIGYLALRCRDVLFLASCTFWRLPDSNLRASRERPIRTLQDLVQVSLGECAWLFIDDLRHMPNRLFHPLHLRLPDILTTVICQVLWGR